MDRETLIALQNIGSIIGALTFLLFAIILFWADRRFRQTQDARRRRRPRPRYDRHIR